MSIIVLLKLHLLRLNHTLVCTRNENKHYLLTTHNFTFPRWNFFFFLEFLLYDSFFCWFHATHISPTVWSIL